MLGDTDTALDIEEIELDEREPTIFFSNSGGDASFDSFVGREAMGGWHDSFICADTS